MTGQKEFSCGLGRWRPQFLQKCATIKCFMFVYGLLGTIQAMAFVYFISTLTTLEKRFQIRTEVTGILMSGNELSQIFLSFLLAYHGGKGNRPVWIAWGVLFSSLSCFILALPHFIYGPGANALALTDKYFDYSLVNATTAAAAAAVTTTTSFRDLHPTVCSSSRITNETTDCDDQLTEKPFLSLSLIFFSQFVLGIGTTLYVTLGQPYLDDNSNKKNTPKLLGLIMALRTAGPALGFILGYFCLNIYIDPSSVPVIERTDPRWLGAWWLGWVVLGTVMTMFSLLIASFPRQLPPRTDPNEPSKCAYESVATTNSKPEVVSSKPPPLETKDCGADDAGIFTDFKNALKRVCGNALLMCNVFTAVFYILGGTAHINFYTKYAETLFHQSAASSSMIAGVTTVTSMVFGLITSGFLISKFKPKERYLLLLNLVIAVAYMAGEVIFMFLGCEEETLQGKVTETGMIDPSADCNANCSCQGINYSPVCFERGKQTFFSACHAGCTQMGDEPQMTYSNCSCLPHPSDTVRLGPCKVDCTFDFVVFVAVQCVIQLIGCSGRITNILINYRCVEPRDKPLAQGIALFMVSLVAFIPGPIIFGKVIDGTCQIWDEKCGKRGNCWVYNKITFRSYLNSTALCFTFVAFLFDIAVYFLGRNIKLYEEAPTEKKT